jgi:hypothetical protein
LSVGTSSQPGHEVLEQMYGAVLPRFPLLQLLHFADRPDIHPTQFPNFIALIASLFRSGDKPCCVVLPDKGEAAIAVSTLIAVTRLCRDFPEILRNHASVTFKPGEDHVLVHPCGLVYRYDGFFNPEFFKLGVVDRKDARSLPVTEIARLEKTIRKRPKGLLGSDLGQARPTILGSLLGIKTSLNRNFLRNYVLVLGARKHFVEALERWTIEAPTASKNPKRLLKEEVAFGKVAEGGELCFLDDYVAAGEPLIAVASRADDLAARCTRTERFSKAVLVDEIEYLTRDFSAYDSITESQHTVILGSDSQREYVRQLENRGCEVWRLTPDEILFGLNGKGSEVPLADVVAKATTSRRLVISGLSCEEEYLDRAAAELQKVTDIADATDNGAVRELLYSLYRILMFCAQHLGHRPEDFATLAERLLQVAKRNGDRAGVWLTRDANDRIKDTIDYMKSAVGQLSKSDVTPKGELLLKTLQKEDKKGRIAVVVPRGEANCEGVREWLNKSGIQVEIYSLGGIPEKQAFGRILIISWPRSERFDHLVHEYLTDDLELLAYPFEERWLNLYRKGYKRLSLSGVSAKRKMQRLGLSLPGMLDEDASAESKDELAKFNLSSERFLTRRKIGPVDESAAREEAGDEFVEAWYVDFAGPTFAYLSEGHELAVLNAYVSGQQTSPGKVPLRSVEDLKEGDYVMFRESGDSDIIRFLAEDELGRDKYKHLRLTANRWRAALQKLGTDPRQVLERLRPFGFSRHLQTVRGWLADQNIICPQDITDVRKIAGAAHDEELLMSLPELERARDELMSSHISAGFRLTELLLKELPKKIGVLGQGETELDLGVGKVWVVRIEEIDRSPSTQRRSQVNRLLWDAGAV